MDMRDQLEQLAGRAPKLKEVVQTEEAAKNAFVMPFLTALGYEVFNPAEVIPEYTADHGVKKGEKVDYAIVLGGKVELLIECKKVSVDLSQAEHSQLYRYFSVTAARIGVLTNGVQYRFYTDLESQNQLDQKPFLEVDLENLTEHSIRELKKLTKSNFDLEKILSTAEDLKYSKAIKNLLNQQMTEPSDDFVRFFATQVHPGRRMTQNVLLTFRSLVKKSLVEFINEQINRRLQSAMAEQKEEAESAEAAEALPEESEDGIVTTDDELEGYRIVRSIVREVVDVERVAIRDAKSYCSVLLDDNNRKPICRLRFNNPKRLVLGVFDDRKQESKVDLESLDDIFTHAEVLKATAALYDAGKSKRPHKDATSGKAETTS